MMSRFTLATLNGETVEHLNDAQIGISNTELDALVLSSDEKNKIGARIARLASLNPIEQAKEIKATAKELGVPMAAIKKAIKDFGRDADTKGQGRPIEFQDIEPWPHAIDGSKLIDETCQVIRRYLVLPNGSMETLALWAIHTHAFRCFGHTPRLAITSPEKGCGKTTALDVLAELVARPLLTSNATVSAVFRTIEIAAPTLLIDEGDTFLKKMTSCAAS